MATHFAELKALVESLPVECKRWARGANESTLIEWRDRTEAPGLAARGTSSGYRFYGFDSRQHFDRKGPTLAMQAGRSGSHAAFNMHGDLIAMMLTRKPKTKRGIDVVTRLAIGGGSLNFMGRNARTRSGKPAIMRGITGVSAVAVRGRVVNVPAAPTSGYQALRHGKSVHISGYLHPAHTRPGRTHYVFQITYAERTYAEEWYDLTRDQAWLLQRRDVRFREILRSATLTKKGKVRARFTARLPANVDINAILMDAT